MSIGEPDAAVDLLEPIKEENRMCVEYTHVSANVPSSFATPGIFPGLSLPKFGKREESGPKMRRVRPSTCRQRLDLSIFHMVALRIPGFWMDRLSADCYFEACHMRMLELPQHRHATIGRP